MFVVTSVSHECLCNSVTLKCLDIETDFLHAYRYLKNPSRNQFSKSYGILISSIPLDRIFLELHLYMKPIFAWTCIVIISW